MLHDELYLLIPTDDDARRIVPEDGPDLAWVRVDREYVARLSGLVDRCRAEYVNGGRLLCSQEYFEHALPRRLTWTRGRADLLYRPVRDVRDGRGAGLNLEMDRPALVSTDDVDGSDLGEPVAVGLPTIGVTHVAVQFQAYHDVDDPADDESSMTVPVMQAVLLAARDLLAPRPVRPSAARGGL